MSLSTASRIDTSRGEDRLCGGGVSRKISRTKRSARQEKSSEKNYVCPSKWYGMVSMVQYGTVWYSMVGMVRYVLVSGKYST